jgi:hypothetical protein
MESSKKVKTTRPRSRGPRLNRKNLEKLAKQNQQDDPQLLALSLPKHTPGVFHRCLSRLYRFFCCLRLQDADSALYFGHSRWGLQTLETGIEEARLHEPDDSEEEETTE